MVNKEFILNEINRLIEESKSSIGNIKTIALNEAWKILQVTVAYVVQILEKSATELSGADKKALAMELLSKFYDGVFIVVDIPFVPNILEPIIHKQVKNILMLLVSGSIDATVTIFRKTGVFLTKGQTK